MDTENHFASASEVMKSLAELTEDELWFLQNNLWLIKKRIAQRLDEIEKITFVTPLSDVQLQKQYPQFVDKLKSWRKAAKKFRYDGPVVWLVKKGFTLKNHAPFAGPCYRDLEFLKDWSRLKETPTSNSLIFWIPRIVSGSKQLTLEEMIKYREDRRKIYRLPSDHCDRFGSITELFALILGLFKYTGERVPLGSDFAVSDTMFTSETGKVFCFMAGEFDDLGGLDCDFWDCTSKWKFIGFFLLGVEEI